MLLSHHLCSARAPCTSHDALCSGTASGELHFWDASSGAFIFGVAARHPNNPGLTAMSSNEGSLEGGGGGGGGIKTDGSEGRSGGGGASGVGTLPITAAGGGGAPVVAGGIADLLLYTACEEGFVKTWRVGERFGTGVTEKTVDKRTTCCCSSSADWRWDNFAAEMSRGVCWLKSAASRARADSALPPPQRRSLHLCPPTPPS